MKQVILNSYAGECGQLRYAIAGAVKHGAALELRWFPEAVLRTRLAELDAANTVYHAARAAHSAAQHELDRVCQESRIVIPRVVAALSLTFGASFTPSWRTCRGT